MLESFIREEFLPIYLLVTCMVINIGSQINIEAIYDEPDCIQQYKSKKDKDPEMEECPAYGQANKDVELEECPAYVQANKH